MSDEDRVRLDAMGLDDFENLATRIVLSVWRQIDFDSPLWKSVGKELYQRFEHRIKSCACEPTLKLFAGRLARKCHAQAGFDEVLLIDLKNQNDMGSRDASVLRVLREQPGLVVSALRIVQEQRKAERAIA